MAQTHVRPITRLPVSADVGDVTADVRRLFEELARQRPDRRQAIVGECLPLLDVFETQDALDLVLDVPGVPAANIRILVKGGRGHRRRRKGPPRAQALRGRRATTWSSATSAASPARCAMHVAVDAAQAAATLRDGELRIVLPEDRRAARPRPAGDDRDGAAGVKLLFIGDIVGRPGRELVKAGVPALVARHDVDFVIANGENAAAGFGITRELGDQLFSFGVDVLTSGNHIWDKKEVLDYIPAEPRLLRPANYPAGAPGAGAILATAANGVRVGVVNVMGRVFLANIDDPFTTAAREVARLQGRGRADRLRRHARRGRPPRRSRWGGISTARPPPWSAPTRTCRPPTRGCCRKGTAYLTDVGMTGPHDGVIGVEKAAVIGRFLNGAADPVRDRQRGPRLHAVVITADPATGRATAIERLSHDRRRARRPWRPRRRPGSRPRESRRRPALRRTAAARAGSPRRAR